MKLFPIPPKALRRLLAVNLKTFKEKPSFNYLVNAGIYLLDSSILSLIKPEEFLDMPELLLRAKNNSLLWLFCLANS